MLATLLLALVALQLAWRIVGRRSVARRLFPEPRDGHPYRAWSARLAFSFGLPALVALVSLDRADALWRLPPEFEPVAALARAFAPFQVWPTVVGLLLGTLVAALITRWRRRRGGRPFYLGRPPRLPAHPAELPAAAVLSVAAGVTEELYFRLLLPLLVALAIGSATAGFLLAAALFGLSHRYQGWVGMVATTLVALFLSAVYLSSGALWLAMACHAAIDLNGLVLRPGLALWSQGRR
ncbi:MAG TPA: CPBP family intramembrane glutamic endopeptidase [Sphingomonas sp.]